MRAIRAFVLLASLGIAPPARADAGDPGKNESADAITEARSHFRLGSAYYRGGAYDLALKEFEAAYKIDPRPDMLFNLGQCQRMLGHDREALAFYRAFLRDLPDSPRRAEVQSYVDELTKKLAAEPAPPAPPAPPPPRPSAENPPPAAVTPPPSVPAAPESSRLPSLKRLGLGVGISGLVVAVGGAALLGAAAADRDQLNNPQPGAVFDPALLDRMGLLRDTGAAAVGVGLAAGVAGAVMYGIGLARAPAVSAGGRSTFQLAWEF